MKIAFLAWALIECASIAATVYLIVAGHDWWAVAFFVITIGGGVQFTSKAGAE